MGAGALASGPIAGGDDVNGALAACAAGVASGPLRVNDGAIEGVLEGAGGVVDGGWMLLMLRTAVTGSGEVCDGGAEMGGAEMGGAAAGGDVGGDVGAPVGPFGSVSGMQRQH